MVADRSCRHLRCHEGRSGARLDRGTGQSLIGGRSPPQGWVSSAYRIVYAPEARQNLLAIDRYIAREASPEVARQYTDSIVEKCEGLAVFPHRGTRRDDIRTGVRTIPFRRRVTIA